MDTDHTVQALLQQVITHQNSAINTVISDKSFLREFARHLDEDNEKIRVVLKDLMQEIVRTSEEAYHSVQFGKHRAEIIEKIETDLSLAQRKLKDIITVLTKNHSYADNMADSIAKLKAAAAEIKLVPASLEAHKGNNLQNTKDMALGVIGPAIFKLSQLNKKLREIQWTA